jgi:hypothetical protein
MSVTTPTASQRPSILAAFQTAPTSVKVLVAILYGLGVLTLIEMAVFVAGGGFIVPQDHVAAVVSDLAVLVMVLILFLLGSGITRGYFGSWLATLILTFLFGIQSVQVILIGVTGRTMFRAGEVVAVLALLLTPAVRQHCLKRRAIGPALAVEGDDDGSA